MFPQAEIASDRESPRPQRQCCRIELSGLTKRFLTPKGEAFTALREVSFDVQPGQFCAIVGPTGCGKSTTLGMVAGLDKPSAGSITVGGRAVTGVTDGISFMFQADALLPWKTVLGNVMMGPILKRTRQAEGRGAGPGLAAPGRARGVRGPLPAPALRRDAQARRDGGSSDQRAQDPVDG